MGRSTFAGPPIALSIGDPAGIGPEIIAAAWNRRAEENLPPFFVVGGAEVIAKAVQSLGLNIPLYSIDSIDEVPSLFGHSLPVFGTVNAASLNAEYSPGSPTMAGARLALSSLETATQLTLDGAASAMATAPIAKSHLAAIGFSYPGQTEFLAASCGLGADEAVMMLAGPQLRAVPLTVHCPLSEVSTRISHALILQKSKITAAALRRDFGIERPRIAITGLNPHAGEDGKFGREEIEIIGPAIAALQAEGMNASGPHPADALFAPHGRSGFDAAICMYHDQALIPVKALDFDQGVNVTLGLPIIRTSPDHGTAFNIAGTGRANPSAMIAAIRMAGECAERRANG